MAEPVQPRRAGRARQADTIFIPDGADAVPAVVQTLNASGVTPAGCSFSAPACGMAIRASSRRPAAQGGWFAAPDPAGFRAFAGRYRAKYGQDPVRTATLSVRRGVAGGRAGEDARSGALCLRRR